MADGEPRRGAGRGRRRSGCRCCAAARCVSASLDGHDRGDHAALGAEPGTRARRARPPRLRRRRVRRGGPARWPRTLLAGGADSDAERGRIIAAWLDLAPGDRLRPAPGLPPVLSHQGAARGASRSRPGRSLPPGTPGADATSRRASSASATAQCGLLVARRTAALLRVAIAVIERYEALKARHAVLDYDDLIERTNALLRPAGQDRMGALQARRADRPLLVDEAQDTSPAQWRIILQADRGVLRRRGRARPSPRTLFVVGDEKQSIYSFQGADLANFRRVRERLTARAAAGGQPLREASCSTARSARCRPCWRWSTPCSRCPRRAAACSSPRASSAPRHRARRRAGPGRALAAGRAGRSGARATSLAAARRATARRTSRSGASPGRSRARSATGSTAARSWRARASAVRPGDIMILLSRRGILQERLVRALKQAGVPAAGADRLALLRQHIAGPGPDRARPRRAAARGRPQPRLPAQEPAARPRRGRAVRARLRSRRGEPD